MAQGKHQWVTGLTYRGGSRGDDVSAAGCDTEEQRRDILSLAKWGVKTQDAVGVLLDRATEEAMSHGFPSDSVVVVAITRIAECLDTEKLRKRISDPSFPPPAAELNRFKGADRHIRRHVVVQKELLSLTRAHLAVSEELKRRIDYAEEIALHNGMRSHVNFRRTLKFIAEGLCIPELEELRQDTRQSIREAVAFLGEGRDRGIA